MLVKNHKEVNPSILESLSINSGTLAPYIIYNNWPSRSRKKYNIKRTC